VKERPIIMQAESVRAILDGRKTQTRRVIKPQPPGPGYELMTCMSTTGNRHDEGRHHWGLMAANGYEMLDSRQPYFACPYGVPGDRLWVRETWCPLERCDWIGTEREKNVNYRADCPPASEAIREEMGYAWRSSIFMPRWASRLTLEITDVRVQRVQEITRDDALAEGVSLTDSLCPEVNPRYKSLQRFPALWDSINAKRGFGWERNPWVWAITFKQRTNP
jgi:hypothetical protein